MKKKGTGHRPPIYPESLKIMVAREYLTGELSMLELANKHQLANSQVVQGFVRWYQKWEALQQSLPAVASQKPDTGLTQELKDAQLRITALELLIKNAEKELGIDIVKKLGTKQPPK